MNKQILSIIIVTNAILVASAFAQYQSILPGGCVINKKLESVSLSDHSITVKAGQEFTVKYNFGRGSDANAWGVINLANEIDLLDFYQLESYPPTTIWVFKPKFSGNYTIFFQNKLSHDVISVHVEVIS